MATKPNTGSCEARSTLLTHSSDSRSAMSVVREVTTIDRVCACGIRSRRQEGVGLTSEGKTNGRLMCGVASCPWCGGRVAQYRAEETREALTRHTNADGRVLFMTLTLGHVKRNLPLARFIDVLMKVWAKTMDRSAYKRHLRNLGIGYIRAVEVTHSSNGWHPHLHVLFFVDGAHLEEAEYWAEQTMSNWRAVVRDYGHGFRTAKIAQDLQTVDADEFSTERLGLYVTKEGKTWDVADELTKGREKEARGQGMTPQQMLARFNATGEDRYRQLYVEWERAIFGRRMFEWSRSLRQALALGAEIEDQELVNTDTDVMDEVVGMSGHDFNTKTDEALMRWLRELVSTADFTSDTVAGHFAEWMSVTGVHLYFGAEWHERRQAGEDHREKVRQVKRYQRSSTAKIVRLMNRRVA